MGIAVSLLLIALGAILTWAVTAEVQGLDVQVVGVILMLVGILGFFLDLLFWESWGPRFGRRAAYVEPGAPSRRRPYGPRRATYVEEEAAPDPPLDPP